MAVSLKMLYTCISEGTTMKYYGTKEGILATLNQSDLSEYEGVTIKLVPAVNYLV